MPDDKNLRSNEKSTIRAFLSGEEPTFATVLVGYLTKHFSSFEWFDWDPDVFGQEVQDDFKVKMPIEVRDQIWSMVTALTTDRFYQDVQAFNNICNGLSGGPTPMTSFEPAELAEIAWALLEIGMSDLDEDEQDYGSRFSDEVRGFISFRLSEEGLQPFGPMEFVQNTGGEISMPDDPVMAKAQDDERQETQNDIVQTIENGMAKLQNDLRRLGLASADTSSKMPLD